MTDLGGRELLREWRKLMDSVVDSAASVAGRGELPQKLLETMQHQLKLVEEVIEGEKRFQREMAARLAAPVDAVFDLLEETGATLRRQAEALESAGRALEETATLMKSQAEPSRERSRGCGSRPSLPRLSRASSGGIAATPV